MNQLPPSLRQQFRIFNKMRFQKLSSIKRRALPYGTPLLILLIGLIQMNDRMLFENPTFYVIKGFLFSSERKYSFTETSCAIIFFFLLIVTKHQNLVQSKSCYSSLTNTRLRGQLSSNDFFFSLIAFKDEEPRCERRPVVRTIS